MTRPIGGGMVLIGRRSDLMSYRCVNVLEKIAAHSAPCERALGEVFILCLGKHNPAPCARPLRSGVGRWFMDR